MNKKQEQVKVASAFGAAVRRLRRGKDISQTELGALADMDRVHISLLERGLQEPRLSTIVNLARGLGVSPGELVDMAFEPPTDN